METGGVSAAFMVFFFLHHGVIKEKLLRLSQAEKKGNLNYNFILQALNPFFGNYVIKSRSSSTTDEA